MRLDAKRSFRDWNLWTARSAVAAHCLPVDAETLAALFSRPRPPLSQFPGRRFAGFPPCMRSIRLCKWARSGNRDYGAATAAFAWKSAPRAGRGRPPPGRSRSLPCLLSKVCVCVRVVHSRTSVRQSGEENPAVNPGTEGTQDCGICLELFWSKATSSCRFNSVFGGMS